MGFRLSKITTRTGDNGTTGLADGSRVRKDCARIEAIGTLDELNSLIGLLLADPASASLQSYLYAVQHDLFDLGGELALPGQKILKEALVLKIEQAIETLNQQLPPLKEFILPGGNHAAAVCHCARSVCRRAERRLFEADQEQPLNPMSLRYLNRLSDLLFIMARQLARQQGGSEMLWDRSRLTETNPETGND